MKSESLEYRPEIDGLRTIAVVPVILFHAGVTQFQAGFFGVDVFFVISGYLITSVIMRGLDSERGFSVLHFYERRARRILPALALTVLITLAIAPFVLVPGQIKDVGQSVFATALFLSNYFFYFEIDYFNQFASKAPLLHTWSLAVEEQFYLVFPLILIALHRAKLRFTWFIALVFAASFAAALWTTEVNPQLSFYSIHTRAWELAAGAAAALYLKHRGKRGEQGTTAQYVSLSALAVLAWSLTFLPTSWPHPGWATIFPVGSTVLLVVFLRPGALAFRFLASRWMVHIGLMSYGLYLYHNPLFSFVDVYFDYLGEGTLKAKLALIPVVYLIALASLHLVERPAMRGAMRQRGVVLTAVVGIGLFATLGALIHYKNGFQNELASYYRSRGMEMLVDVPAERAQITENRERFEPLETSFDCEREECNKILIIGDSLSDDTFLALSNYGQDALYRRVYFDDECMGDIASVAQLKAVTQCRGRPTGFSDMLEFADEIVIAAKWQESTYRDAYKLASLLERELDKPVVVSGAAMFTDLSSFSIKAWRAGYTSVGELDRPLYDMQRWDRLRTTDSLHNLVSADPRVDWFDRHAFFCNRDRRTCTLFDPQGGPLIWDNAHMTFRAYKPFARYFENSLQDLREKRAAAQHREIYPSMISNAKR